VLFLDSLKKTKQMVLSKNPLNPLLLLAPYALASSSSSPLSTGTSPLSTEPFTGSSGHSGGAESGTSVSCLPNVNLIENGDFENNLSRVSAKEIILKTEKNPLRNNNWKLFSFALTSEFVMLLTTLLSPLGQPSTNGVVDLKLLEKTIGKHIRASGLLTLHPPNALIQFNRSSALCLETLTLSHFT
jgi:hypothetical protein